MSELQDLYQEVIIDHSRRPRNCRRQEAPTCAADGYNPLCGDRVKVYLTLDGDTIRDVSFEGSGCAISTASASMMTEALKGCSLQDARALFQRFHGLVTDQAESAPAEAVGAGTARAMVKLAVFEGVKQFPARVKCATLAWHALMDAVKRRLGDGAPSPEPIEGLVLKSEGGSPS